MEPVNWDLLLGGSKRKALVRWAFGQISTRVVSKDLAFTHYAGEFRRLVRERGTQEARRLARKAVRRRNLV
jgi:hypothetical protein